MIYVNLQYLLNHFFNFTIDFSKIITPKYIIPATIPNIITLVITRSN